jgi:hypothetical protein
MFKRRRQRTTLEGVKEIFWPSMGWMRAARYAKHRVIRLSASTHSITCGLVCGMCISFSPLFGFHFLLAVAYARLMGGNYLAAIIGTFFGNPWTFPILFILSYETGSFVLSFFGGAGLVETSNPSDLGSIEGSSIAFFLNNFWDLYLPTLLGSFICMAVFWPIYYYPVYFLVRSAQKARRARMRRKWRKQVAKEEARHAHENPNNSEDEESEV